MSKFLFVGNEVIYTEAGAIVGDPVVILELSDRTRRAYVEQEDGSCKWVHVSTLQVAAARTTTHPESQLCTPTKLC